MSLMKKIEEAKKKSGVTVSKIVPEPSQLFSAAIYDTFARPALAMVCWGAFVHMTNLPLEWCLGYWPFFMLNFVALLFTSAPVTHWIVKDVKTEE